MSNQEANNKRDKNLTQIIETFKSLISVFEKMATPRHQFTKIRWALTCAIECVEKQISMTPTGANHNLCPRCSKSVVKGADNYCPNCGQRLRWSEE